MSIIVVVLYYRLQGSQNTGEELHLSHCLHPRHDHFIMAGMVEHLASPRKSRRSDHVAVNHGGFMSSTKMHLRMIKGGYTVNTISGWCVFYIVINC